MDDTLNDNDLQQDIALLHEAAHVVARAALGLPYCAVEVDGYGLGEAHGSGEVVPAWARAKVAMAGQAAETKFSPATKER